MIKSHSTKTAFLLTTILLLSGCSENNSNSVFVTDTPSTIVSYSGSSQAQSLSENKNLSIESSTQSSDERSSTELVQSYSESIVLTSVEFTDKDRELQKILSNLLVPTEEILSWYVEMTLPTPVIQFNFPQFENIPSGCFALVPENYRVSDIFSPFEMPTTRDSMREIMLEYFSEEYTESRVGDIVSGTMTKNSDGTYSVTVTDKLADPSKFIYSKFVEVNGRLYQREGIKPVSINMDCSTAKIVSKTDDTIEFTYLLNTYAYEPKPEYKNEPLYSENALKGVLKYERDGWKLDSWEFQ